MERIELKEAEGFFMSIYIKSETDEYGSPWKVLTAFTKEELLMQYMAIALHISDHTTETVAGTIYVPVKPLN